ncbi:hypothetical protein GP486_001984 [Trichoglossum hirsutum]|uniref:Uncharacterized protein n=1 Tax=Trichoglossum hirsutum TaxID=265104 RepID=A0A9P8LFT0_9PEZI|nr:hypothetical protein GP486_001984 [Trichoglossum hirsutum]
MAPTSHPVLADRLLLPHISKEADDLISLVEEPAQNAAGVETTCMWEKRSVETPMRENTVIGAKANQNKLDKLGPSSLETMRNVYFPETDDRAYQAAILNGIRCSEGGSAASLMMVCEGEGSYSWYLLARYEHRSLIDIRQLAVYSLVYPDSGSAIFILRNVPDDLKNRIKQFSGDELYRDPFLLHVLITDWVIFIIRQRWLRFDGQVFSLNGRHAAGHGFFDVAKTQRHLEELVLTIEMLSDQYKLICSADSGRVEDGFSSHLFQCKLLKSRLTSIQQLGKDIVQNTLNFASFENSATMKAIAVVTMLTLPGVLVSHDILVDAEKERKESTTICRLIKLAKGVDFGRQELASFPRYILNLRKIM